MGSLHGSNLTQRLQSQRDKIAVSRVRFHDTAPTFIAMRPVAVAVTVLGTRLYKQT